MRMQKRRGLRHTLVAGAYGACSLGLPQAADAQIALPGGGKGSQVSRNEPVTFQADHVDYDSKQGLVTWSGHVEIWQNDHVLKADTVTFDRNTNVAAAHGHVVIIEPDGQVVFSDYAELTQGMRQGIMTNIRTLLAMDGKLAANGARRTDGKVNDLSRAVYTACKICAQHPEKPPFWQIRSYAATDDLEHKRIEYRDVYLDMLGVPVGYIPYFSSPDPSVKRQSGFLLGDIAPSDDHLGTYVTLPYYWVISDSADATFVPLLASNSDPQLSIQYRQHFNDGILHVTGGIAGDEGAMQGYLMGHAVFDLNSTWRAGADVNLASSANYMRDYRIPGYGNDTLSSSVFLEGFGVGSYARLDSQVFQGLNSVTVNNSELPFVLPRFTYAFQGQPDAWGGRFSMNSTDFNIYRANGVSDKRAQLELQWDRPFHDSLGQQFLFTARLDGSVWSANKLDQIPVYGSTNAATTARALPTVALKMNWPFLRTLKGGSTQIVEPIVQVIAAPNTGNSVNDNIPNEDSLDYEFTDTTLFALNRHEGFDRLDGGLRANVGLHGNWSWGGQQFDALVGQSYQEHIDHNQVPDTGLGTRVSDIVARGTYSPAKWLDLTARGRFDHDSGQTHFADGLISVGVPLFRVTGGYIYNSHDLYYYYDTNYRTGTVDSAYYVPRNEATLGVSSTYKEYRVNGFARRDLATNKLVAIGADGAYSNDCFTFDIAYVKRYTTINGDQGDQSILFTLTFKTLGAFAVNG